MNVHYDIITNLYITTTVFYCNLLVYTYYKHINVIILLTCINFICKYFYYRECEQEMWKNVTDDKGLLYIIRVSIRTLFLINYIANLPYFCLVF